MQKTHLYKRCLRAAAFVLALSLPLASLAESFRVVTGGRLNLRETPSLSAKVLGQYPSGTWMNVESTEGDWSKVSVNGKEGYVMSKYLADSASSSSHLYVRTNTGRGLNLRTQPSLEGDIITSFKPGTAVTVIAKGSGWHKVSVDGQSGYMSSQFLTSGQNSSTAVKTGVVRNPGANQVLLLRETASTDARVLGYFSNGTQVQIVGEKGDFYQVNVGGKSGYMMKKFIQTSTSSSSTLPEAPFAAELINPNGNKIVNFRTAPGLNASIIKAHAVGTKITVLETGDVWCKAEIDGVTGYVSRYFFKVVK